MKFILAVKKRMDQIFTEESGKMIPVTVVKAGPCYITQVKLDKPDGYSAVQVAFGKKREKLLTKSLLNHLKESPGKRFVREFRVDSKEAEIFSKGDKITSSCFKAGDIVSVTGVSKGQGFQGVVKRHGFAGSPASHGHKDQLRMPGSIGATDPAHVFKGTRMPGRMGANRATVGGLKIIKTDEKNNLLYIKGAVSGAINGFLLIKTAEGVMTPETREDVSKNKKTDKESKAKEPVLKTSEKMDKINTKIKEEVKV